jgi:eukaryotic-like serine/threonine-protein kinase
MKALPTSIEESDTLRAGPPRHETSRPVLDTGQAVGRYTITGFLGGGGMGEVYTARDHELERDLAVKVLRPEIGGASLTARVRFLREAQALARLSHPNVVAVHDVGSLGDQIWSPWSGSRA